MIPGKLESAVIGYFIANGECTFQQAMDDIPFNRHDVEAMIWTLLGRGKLVQNKLTGRLGFVKVAKRGAAPKRTPLEPTDPIDRGRAARAITAALEGPFRELRGAAIVVLRKALVNSRSIQAAARRLGVSTQTLFKIRDRFPREWKDASHRTG